MFGHISPESFSRLCLVDLWSGLTGWCLFMRFIFKSRSSVHSLFFMFIRALWSFFFFFCRWENNKDLLQDLFFYFLVLSLESSSCAFFFFLVWRWERQSTVMLKLLDRCYTDFLKMGRSPGIDSFLETAGERLTVQLVSLIDWLIDWLVEEFSEFCLVGRVSLARQIFFSERTSIFNHEMIPSRTLSRLFSKSFVPSL